MKSEKTTNQAKTDKYPKLMVRIQRDDIVSEIGMVVLFTDQTSGTVVYTPPGCGSFQIGEFLRGWNCDRFVDYDESIVLSNE